MGVRVLGPLEVGDADRAVRVPGTMRRRLLAVLSLTPQVERSSDEIIDALWGDSATSSSAGTLQSHVTRLRHDLPDPGWIVTGPRGYLLDLPPDAVDAVRFSALADEGARLLASGDASRASQALSDALSLWRGAAYGEFAGVTALEREASRLDARRVDVSELLLAAELDRPGTVPPVAALEAFVDGYPLRESGWALLVRALYRCGRQADALAALRRARDLLAAELAIDPGPELRELEQLVLRQDPSLAPPRPAPRSAEPTSLMERRPVSVVAVSSAEREDDWLRDLVVDRAALHGGTARIGVDGRLVAVLGWPSAHEDDPERAVRLAASVVAAAGDRGRAVSVGIATGRVAGSSRDSAPTGAPLIVSSGLARRADPGQVLVDVRTAERLVGVADVEAVDDTSSRLVALRRPGPDARAMSDTPFVGRARDLATLHAAFQQASGDLRAHLVTVVAEAGVGKSRLVQELASSLPSRVVWRTGHCRPYGDRVAYGPLLDVVRHQAAIADDDDEVLLRQRLAALVPGPEGELVADRLAPLLGAPTDLSPSRGDTQRALRLVLQSLADRGPAVLHVEDVHWAPPALLDFIEELVADPEPVPLLVVTTARPELFRVRPTWGSGEVPGATLALTPLASSDVLELLDHLPLTDDERAQLAERSGGNPFFAEELARLAAQSGDVSVAPHALDALVEARLDSLPVDERHVLLSASVAGPRFLADQVAQMLGRDAEEVGSRLDALVRKQFLRRAQGGRRSLEVELQFVHDLVEHAAYRRLLPEGRARHHLSVATFWRGADGRGLELRADLVAHHELSAYDDALDGRDPDLAEEARVRAAESALEAGTRVQAFDNGTARLLVSRAVDLSTPGTDGHALALGRLAGVEFDAREFHRCLDLVRRAVPMLEGRDEDAVVDALGYWIIALFSLGAPLDEAQTVLQRGLDRVPSSRALVRMLGWTAMLDLIQQTPGSMRAARDVAARALAIDEEIRCGGTGFAHVVHGRARVALGDEAGLTELEEWLDDVERHEPASVALGAWQWWAGAVHHWRGSVAEWRARERLAYLAESRGLGFLYSMGVSEQVRVLWELGRLRECVQVADEVDLSHGDAMPRWCVVQRALALADLGELDDASVEVVRRTPPADEGDLRHVVGMAAVEMHAALAVGELGRARDQLRSLGDLTELVRRDGAFELLPRIVRLALDAGCADLVSDVTGIDLEDTPLRRFVAAHVGGLLAHASGDDTAARLLLSEAAEGWRSFGTASEERAARDALDLL